MSRLRRSMLFVLISYLWRTDRRHSTTTIDVSGYASAIQLNQCRTGDRARRTVNLILTVTGVSVFSDTRACTKDMTASTCSIRCLTSDTSLEHLYFGTVTYVTILSTTIDRAIDGWAGTINSTILCRTTDIDNSLIDISAIEVWQILV